MDFDKQYIAAIEATEARLKPLAPWLGDLMIALKQLKQMVEGGVNPNVRP
jgi:hypothetical protein